MPLAGTPTHGRCKTGTRRKPGRPTGSACPKEHRVLSAADPQRRPRGVLFADRHSPDVRGASAALTAQRVGVNTRIQPRSGDGASIDRPFLAARACRQCGAFEVAGRVASPLGCAGGEQTWQW
jgi:hypothetical protein